MLTCTTAPSDRIDEALDWPSILADCARGADVLQDRVATALIDLDKVNEDAVQCASAMFVDAHNTGFYINSYTTKVAPGMDGVLNQLVKGVRRLRLQWQAAGAGEPGEGAPEAPKGREGLPADGSTALAV